MNKFDSENSDSDIAVYPKNDSLPQALSALPALAPTQDRLQSVLRALAEKRALADTQSAKLPPRSRLLNPQTQLLIALAASLMIGVTAMFLRPSQLSKTSVIDTAANRLPAMTKNLDASTEIVQLIAVSQQLEAGLRELGQSSASFSQLYGRKQAELSLATLDTDLAEVMASNSGQAIDQQRALWRERVAVLSAVESGDYRKALFVVD